MKKSKLPKAKKRLGRPAIYSEALGEKICAAIATSAKGLKTLCKRPGMPSQKTVYRWLAGDVGQFRRSYAHAKELQAQVLFDQIVELADKPQLSTSIKTTAHGKKERRVSDNTERSKLRIEARKWALSKLLPHRYGDRPSEDRAADPLEEILKEMRKASQRLGRPVGDDEEEVQPIQ